MIELKDRTATDIAEVYLLLSNAESKVHQWLWISFKSMTGYKSVDLYSRLVSGRCPIVYDPRGDEVGIMIPGSCCDEACSDLRREVYSFFGI